MAVAGREASVDALIEAAAGGDRAAIESLVLAHWDDAYRVAYLLLHDRGAAEEVAQDALLNALRALDSFEIGRPFGPWVARIAANRAHDALRRRRRRPALASEPPIEDAVDDTELADQVAASALSDELVAGLGEINPDHRAAVVLRHLLDHSAEEIAAITGVAPGTVRTRIHRGLLALREILEGKERAHE